ncbi:uncharacterized protein SPPG_07496 [Spizellomyces punctatus DAOM BR117]|uniref:Uncharacterized protein n=1 Tax=Spizellomyces punctatus (strain DAOM BR117) TaxID=645134 RepID=A0A0L0H7B3_SPIPD|nr:uncharacterized protein SPPG_07496 [Spizellomyces punctatus DAOM BR117]KNC97102.1 hypothetical protein SPPG_07496 [Spizellomyces punctatus DAOM BR117]|eukprot:XP_016605142.1 hypothetical protein SPPG_07496 [Spizellomyces punctatus DAOM BR117]
MMRGLLAALGAGSIVTVLVIVGLEIIRLNSQWFESGHESRSGDSRNESRSNERNGFGRKTSEDKPREEEERGGSNSREEVELRKRKVRNLEEEVEPELQRSDEPVVQHDIPSLHPLFTNFHEPGLNLSNLNPPADTTNEADSDTDSDSTDSTTTLQSSIQTLKQQLISKRSALQQELADLGWKEEQIRIFMESGKTRPDQNLHVSSAQPDTSSFVGTDISPTIQPTPCLPPTLSEADYDGQSMVSLTDVPSVDEDVASVLSRTESSWSAVSVPDYVKE